MVDCIKNEGGNMLYADIIVVLPVIISSLVVVNVNKKLARSRVPTNKSHPHDYLNEFVWKSSSSTRFAGHELRLVLLLLVVERDVHP